MKWTKKLIPRSWRDDVARDIELEATHTGASDAWAVWQLGLVGLRLRAALCVEHIATEVHLAVRRLGRSPGFAAGAMVTFAVGAGLNLAAFSVVDRMLFRPLPFADPDRLVSIFAYNPETGQRYTRLSSKTALLELTGDPRLIEGFAMVDLCDPLRRSGHSKPIRICLASASILDVLGVKPVIGRGFEPSDTMEDSAVALVTYETWQSEFGGRTDVLGTVLTGGSRLHGAMGPAVIVGVLPEGFVLPSVNWAAGGDGLRLNKVPHDRIVTPRDGLSGVVARLAPGSDVAMVQTRFDQILEAEAMRSGGARSPVIVEPLRDGVFWRYRTAMLLLSAAASLLWLLGCANVSMMVALRGRRRQGDVAISAALGASTGRLATGAMIECLVVCAGGAAIGFLTLMWTRPAIESVLPPAVAGVVSATLDPRVVGLGVGVAIAGALLAGLLPAVRIARTDLLAVLQRTENRSTGARVGQGILAAQTAIGFLLVMAAALVGRSFVALYTEDLGFLPRGLYAVSLVPVDAAPLPRLTPEESWSRTRATVARLRAQEWVVAASADEGSLAFGNGLRRPVTTSDGRRFGLRSVLDDFVRTEGISLLAGRDVSAADIGGSSDVALLSTGVVAAVWPGIPPAAAVGRVVTFTNEPPRRVVGVFQDRRSLPARRTTPEVLVPAGIGDPLTVTFRLDPRRLRPADLQDALSTLMAREGAGRVVLRDGTEVFGVAMQDPRTVLVAFGVFGFMAFGLGAVGLATIAGHVATARTRDLAIRQVLGGQPAQLLWLVIREVMRPVLLGLALGTVAAIWAAQYLQSQLHMVDARDPGSYVLGWVLFLAVAFGLTWFPARGVSRRNPIESLRSA